MKKITLPLIALLLVFCMTMPVLATSSVSFTHPEIGEFLTIGFHEHLPFYSIYDYIYYDMLDAKSEWRGMQSNALKLIHNKMPTLDQSLEKVFDSVEGLTSDQAPVDFLYTGILDEYADALKQLSREDRIKAIKILAGFDGAKGYRQLTKLTGFESVDTEALAQNHQEFTVKVEKTKYPYRVLMFHVDEGNWVVYNERYNYVKVSGKWKLARITREYTDDYRTRGKYLHGMSGSDPADILSANEEAMSGLSFGMTLDEASQKVGVQATEKNLTLSTTIYRLPAQAEISFKNGKLVGFKYILENERAYYSAFISLYTRYSDPILVSEQEMTWSTNDLLITLSKGEGTPSISLEAYK